MTVYECKEKFKQTTKLTNIKKYVEDLNRVSKELEKCEDYTNWLQELSLELKPVTAYSDGVNIYIINN